MLLRIKIVHKEKVHQNEFNLVPKFQNIQLQEDKMKQQKDKKERKQCGTVSVTSVTTVSWKLFHGNSCVDIILKTHVSDRGSALSSPLTLRSFGKKKNHSFCVLQSQNASEG